jgi:hypothetical protein
MALRHLQFLCLLGVALASVEAASAAAPLSEKVLSHAVRIDEYAAKGHQDEVIDELAARYQDLTGSYESARRLIVNLKTGTRRDGKAARRPLSYGEVYKTLVVVADRITKLGMQTPVSGKPLREAIEVGLATVLPTGTDGNERKNKTPDFDKDTPDGRVEGHGTDPRPSTDPGGGPSGGPSDLYGKPGKGKEGSNVPDGSISGLTANNTPDGTSEVHLEKKPCPPPCRPDVSSGENQELAGTDTALSTGGKKGRTEAAASKEPQVKRRVVPVPPPVVKRPAIVPPPIAHPRPFPRPMPPVIPRAGRV